MNAGLFLVVCRVWTVGSKRAFPIKSNAARAAATAIVAHAAATPDLFAAQEDDPKSEAKPDIWANFDDFTAKAVALENVALGLSTSIDQLDDLGPAMAALGATCKSCHAAYRE